MKFFVDFVRILVIARSCGGASQFGMSSNELGFIPPMVCIVTKVYFVIVTVVVPEGFSSFDLLVKAELVKAFVDVELLLAIVLKREYFVSFLADVIFALSVNLTT